MDLLKDEEHRDKPQHQEVPDLGAGGEQHDAAQQGDEGRHREVGLQHDQERDETQHHDERQDALLELPHLLSLLRGQHGAPEDYRQSGQLRGLEVDRAKLDPAASAIDDRGNASGEGKNRDEEKEDRHEQQRPGQRAQPAVVDPCHRHHEDTAQERAGELGEGEGTARYATIFRPHQTRGPVGRRNSEDH
jgi:hypothetical protein